MSEPPTAISIDEIIDNASLSLGHWIILTLGLGLMILEGYDTYSVGFVADVLTAEWDVSSSQLGFVLTAGICGSAISYLLIGPVSDRYGRRRLTLYSLIAIGITSLGTMTANDASSFMVWRIATGLALGAALPNVVALVAEYAPARHRSIAVVILYSGFGIGASIGARVSAEIVPVYGWEAVFLIGGVAPLLLLVAIFFGMPESARFLAANPARLSQARDLLLRVMPKEPIPPTELLLVSEVTEKQNKPIARLFRPNQIKSTMSIWAVLGFNGAVTSILSFWLLTLFLQADVQREAALEFSSVMLLGAVGGAYVIGFLMDRLGAFLVLVPLQVLAVLAVAMTAMTMDDPSVVTGFVLGVALMGGTTGAQSLLAAMYSTEIRATGVGWAISFGRLTGIVAPLALGFLADFGWQAQSLVLLCTIPLSGTVIAYLVLQKQLKSQSLADSAVKT